MNQLGDIVEILGTRYQITYDPNSPYETHVPNEDVTPAEIEELNRLAPDGAWLTGYMATTLAEAYENGWLVPIEEKYPWLDDRRLVFATVSHTTRPYLMLGGANSLA